MEIKLELNKRTLMDALIIIQLILLIIFGVSIYKLSEKIESIVGGDIKVSDTVKVDDVSDNTQLPAPAGKADVKTTSADFTYGKKGSDVKVVLFTDYECPFCARFHPSFNQALEEYGDKVEFVIKHFPLNFHPNAMEAAMALECAGEQDKFLEYGDLVLENKDNLSNAKFKELAVEIGIKSSTFDKCLDDEKYKNKVNADMAAGQAAGVQGVPATFVNGELLSGALPYASLKAMIDKNL